MRRAVLGLVVVGSALAFAWFVVELAKDEVAAPPVPFPHPVAPGYDTT